MELVETSFVQVPEGFRHTINFKFEGKEFMALVVETQNETFIRECFVVLDNLLRIDIPKYFGEFKSDVYKFIYDNIQNAMPETLLVASAGGLIKVEWFDTTLQKTIIEDVTHPQLKWMKEQSHIEIDKIY